MSSAMDWHRGLPSRPLNVGVVGATGNVGTMMLRVLAERGVDIGTLRAFASPRSAGTEVASGDSRARVEVLEDADPAGLDVALFSAGASRALEHARRFADAGCVVIDNSSAFRMDPDVPLVVPEVNADTAFHHQGIIANPNCSTIQLVVALAPIARAAGLAHVHITTFQAVSGTGWEAIEELYGQAASLVARADGPAALMGGDRVDEPGSVYPHPIAFNVLPQCDTFDDVGVTKEERKLINESRRILDLPDLAVGATCVRVPVFNAHSEAVHLRTTRPLTASECQDLLSAAPGIILVDDPAAGAYPMPITAAGLDEVFVGRVRRDESAENGLAMFVVADNLRKGAATNAVQILEVLTGH